MTRHISRRALLRVLGGSVAAVAVARLPGTVAPKAQQLSSKLPKARTYLPKTVYYALQGEQDGWHELSHEDIERIKEELKQYVYDKTTAIVLPGQWNVVVERATT